MWTVYHGHASPEVIQQVLKAEWTPTRDAKGDTAKWWDAPKGIIDNPPNLTEYRKETEHFSPIYRSSELSQVI
jgi:hypothetical protein